MGLARVRRWRKWLYRRVVRLQGSPGAISRGMALGFLFGCLCPPGSQLIIGFPVGLLLRANLLALVAGTFVSNPFTYVPLYMFTCKMGEFMLNQLGWPVDLGNDFMVALTAAADLRLADLFAKRLEPLLACWVTGGLTLGLAGLVPTYYLTYAVVIEIHRLRQFSHARRAARRRKLREKDAKPDDESPNEPPAGA